MNEQQRKNMQQVVILVVLLALLGFAAIRMFATLNQGGRSRERRAEARRETDRATSTNMPPVPGSAAAQAAGGTAAPTELRLNPNQFRRFALNPPKNPFVQQREWYNDELSALPGYPEMAESSYFEQSTAYLPDLDILDNEEWASVSVERSVRNDPYELRGESEDGRISTSVTLTPKPDPSESLQWTPATGVPISALTDPNWRSRYGDALAIPASGEAPEKDPAETLDGMEWLDVPGGAPDDGVDGLSTDASGGESLHTIGVSRKNGRSVALMHFNGSAFIVKEGSVLPTHYQVLEVKDDGVVLIDLRDGGSRWVPLGPPPEDAKGAGKERKRRDA